MSILDKFKTEKDIQKEVLTFLKIIKFTVWRQNNGALWIENRLVKFATDEEGRTVRGIPDIIGWCPDGRACFIEIKRPGKKTTQEQTNFIANAKDSGCFALVAYSTDDIEIKAKEFGYLK